MAENQDKKQFQQTSNCQNLKGSANMEKNQKFIEKYVEIYAISETSTLLSFMQESMLRLISLVHSTLQNENIQM